MTQQNIKIAPLVASGAHFIEAERWSDAIHCLTQALRVAPKDASAYALIARAYNQQNQTSKAQSSYHSAHNHAPENPDYLYNLALFYQENKFFPEAEEHYLKLLSKHPKYADASANLGRLYQDTNRPELAQHYYEIDLKLRPNDPDSHFNLAFIHLLTGNYENGWQEYEWRFKRTAVKRTYPHTFKQPRWDGTPFPGQTLLVHGEQGFGDNLQFLRYLPLVKEFGGRVLFEVPKLLVPLFTNYPGIDQLLTYDYQQKTQENFDFFIPLLSLPLIFKTTPTSIPKPKPLLTAPHQLCSTWQKRLASPNYKVGLVWGGHSLPGSAELFRPLCYIDGIDFYGLQTGVPAHEIPTLIDSPNFLSNLGSEIHSFADTAAIISQLDLVITIDTATAHLAGAMGCKVWVLLPFAPDWRWFLERKDSPWYPNMRLFRQSKAGNWQPVISTIKRELEQFSPHNLLEKSNKEC